MLLMTDNLGQLPNCWIGIESIWRNSIKVVRDFLRDKHGTRYMIFDLCLERTYMIVIFF